MVTVKHAKIKLNKRSLGWIFRSRRSGQRTRRVPNAVTLCGNISPVWTLIGVANGAYVSGPVVSGVQCGLADKNAYTSQVRSLSKALRNLFRPHPWSRLCGIYLYDTDSIHETCLTVDHIDCKSCKSLQIRDMSVQK